MTLLYYTSAALALTAWLALHGLAVGLHGRWLLRSVVIVAGLVATALQIAAHG
jgi:hypothetical protein